MNGTNELLWSCQQVQWLEALGYDLLGMERALPKRQASNATSFRTESTSVSRKVTTSHAEAVIVRPVLETRRSTAESTRQVTRKPVGSPDRLLLALVRASGRDPSLEETQRLMADWPVETLRGSPEAKRAFWPQLRALRKK